MCRREAGTLTSKRFNFAIVGGGLAATAMLTQLMAMLKAKAAKKLLDPSRMTVQVYHKGEIFGPGFPHSDPADLLQRYLDDVIDGDGPRGELIWQTVLHQTFDLLRDLYLNLTFEERKHFDVNYSSLFFTHAAVRPSVNAEKLLPLLKNGLVEIIKLGKNYRLVISESAGKHALIYRDAEGVEKKDVYRTVVDARGQKKSSETDPSALAKNLRLSVTVQTMEIRSGSGNTESEPKEAAATK